MPKCDLYYVTLRHPLHFSLILNSDCHCVFLVISICRSTYKQTLNLLRNYFRDEKGIGFDKIYFTCFSRSSIYDFVMWLKDVRNSSAQTLNLKLSAIKSFLTYCSEEDMELMPVYLDVCSIHALKNLTSLA
jgi:hypothetical protein